MTPAQRLSAVELLQVGRPISPGQRNGARIAPVEAWPDPVPLTCDAGPAFPADALPSWLGPFVHAVAESRQVPLCMPAVIGFATLATAAARKVYVSPHRGWLEPLNLYASVFANSGSRKSAVFADFMRPLLAFEREEQARRLPELRRLRIRREQLEAESHKAKSAGEWVQAEQLAADLDGLPAAAEYRIATGDVTPQRLASMLCDQGGRLAVLSPEPEVFGIMAGRWAKGTPDFNVFLQGHAGDVIRVDRAGRPTETVDAPALTLCVCAQPHTLQQLAGVDGTAERGLLARFLFAFPEDLRGTRRLNPPPVPEVVEAEFHAGLRAVLELPAPADAASIPALRLSPPAQRVFDAFFGEVERRLGPMGDLRDLHGWGEKMAGLSARLAGLFHVAEQGITGEISEDSITHAIAVTRWALEHAKVAFGVAGADPAMRAAKAVLEVLQSDNGEWSVRGVNQILRKRAAFPTAKRTAPGFALLVEHGLIRITEKGTRGRPAKSIELHPSLRARNPSGTLGRGTSESFEPLSLDPSPA